MDIMTLILVSGGSLSALPNLIIPPALMPKGI